jgi:hypothetical protein
VSSAITFLLSVLRLLVTADVPSSPILVTLLIQPMRFSETSVLKRVTQSNIQENRVLQEVLR